MNAACIQTVLGLYRCQALKRLKDLTHRTESLMANMRVLQSKSKN